MTAIGLALAVAAGLMNGSFATPLKKVRGWEWEHSWFLWSVTGLILVPAAVVAATVQDPISVYAAAPAGALAAVAALGVVWGISAILFGRAVEGVGLAIAFATIIGISAAIGAIVPLVAQHPDALRSRPGLLTMAGTALLLAGVVATAAAGRRREESKRVARAGLAICIASGIGAPMINLGLAFGSEIALAAERHGTARADSLNAIWPVLLGGAFLVNAGYCAYLMRRKSSFGAFRRNLPLNAGLSALMGLLWMGSNVVYGYGSRHLGPLGLSVGWPIMMGAVILTANAWSVATGEWRGAPAAAARPMAIGAVLLMVGIAVLGSAAR